MMNHLSNLGECTDLSITNEQVKDDDYERQELLVSNKIAELDIGLENDNTASNANSEWISILMDGRLFTTTRNIIESDRDSALCLLFQSDSPFAMARDDSHPMKPYLLDRNPKYFEPILNYLRTGCEQLVIDRDVHPRGVLLEAQYFNVQSLIPILERYVVKWEQKHGSITLSDNDSELLEEKQLREEPELTRKDVVKALIKCQVPSRLRFRGLKLMKLDLSGLDLSGANLQKCNLSGANLTGVNLEEADLSDTDLRGTVFSHSKMSKCNLSRCQANGALLVGCELMNSMMMNSDFTKADFRDSNMTNANMIHTLLIKANLAGARITGVQLKGTILTGMRHTHSMGGVINMK